MSDGIRARLQMHMSLAKGGSVYIYEAEDYPGLCISRSRETRNHKFQQTVTFNGKDYPNIPAAVEAAKDEARKNAAPAEAPVDHAVRCSTHGHIPGDDGLCCACGAPRMSRGDVALIAFYAVLAIAAWLG